jgi:hypothetical protein
MSEERVVHRDARDRAYGVYAPPPIIPRTFKENKSHRYRHHEVAARRGI